jgi:hypothetical protein
MRFDRVLLMSLGLLSIVVLCLALPTVRLVQADTKGALPLWTPDASLLNQLQLPVTIGAYRIRPPHNYAFSKPAGKKEGVSNFVWEGAVRPDRTYPNLVIVVTQVQQQQMETLTAEKFVLTYLSRIERRHKGVTKTSTEHGTVNGLYAVRARCSHPEPIGQKKRRWLVYAALDAQSIIQIIGQDVEPYSQETLRLIEASVLTFQPAQESESKL